MTNGLTRRMTVLELPKWVPASIRHYLLHTEIGIPIRAVARAVGVHASTVLRQIRKVEGQRDDPLIDGALRMLSRRLKDQADRQGLERGEDIPISLQDLNEPSESTDRFEDESIRIMRRLCESRSVLASARDMDRAVVVREGPNGEASRSGTVDRDVAEGLALREWITLEGEPGRISRYRITSAGRQAFNELLARSENMASGFAEAPAGFEGSGQDATRGASRVMAMRGALAESPLAGLARRRDRDGQFFLSRELVAAGERLREDFELSRLNADSLPDWNAILQAPPDDPIRLGGLTEGSSPEAATARVNAALSFLGDGLGDIVLRTCCFLEGLELAEKRMGWAARSGKVVLRIALQRLVLHYASLGNLGPRIG